MQGTSDPLNYNRALERLGVLLGQAWHFFLNLLHPPVHRDVLRKMRPLQLVWIRPYGFRFGAAMQFLLLDGPHQLAFHVEQV